ncbi:hypothetical protein FB45DRAFT_806440 [Roridomyces roridus]|uniref:Cyclin N-terminal domain-containing protein n=1 Tax=Roridomyces roridus TaxID=1738132 RepID=A0AAD7B296_9AGAR|nr:hypothetical protein FB45DRAFT_806440 [Roridomyces roridus]
MYYSSSSSASSSSSRNSPVHAASLLDPSTHSPELLRLVDVQITGPVIDYVVDCVSETVDYAMGRPSSRGRTAYRSPHIDKFTSFVSTVIERAEVSTATLLVTLVYVARVRPHLSIALEQWALERIFLGALICASKYSNDSTLKNVHWALCTGLFGKRDIGRIEREFLDVLDWELRVGETDLLAHHEGLVRALALPQRQHRRTSTPTRPATTKPYARRHAPVIPDLRSSSPASSSDDSMSPPTPVFTMDDVDVDMDLHPHPRPVKRSAHSAGFHDLLRAFPVPLPHHGHGA